jgi:hypothetical protein
MSLFECVIVTFVCTTMIRFLKSSLVLSILPDIRIRILALFILLFIPIFTFIIGKIQSSDIFKNKNYYQVTYIEFKNPSRIDSSYISNKLIGKLGSHLFLSDTLNSQITVLDIQEIKAIKYKKVSNGRLPFSTLFLSPLSESPLRP